MRKMKITSILHGNHSKSISRIFMKFVKKKKDYANLSTVFKKFVKYHGNITFDHYFIIVRTIFIITAVAECMWSGICRNGLRGHELFILANSWNC